MPFVLIHCAIMTSDRANPEGNQVGITVQLGGIRKRHFDEHTNGNNSSRINTREAENFTE